MDGPRVSSSREVVLSLYYSPALPIWFYCFIPFIYESPVQLGENSLFFLLLIFTVFAWHEVRWEVKYDAFDRSPFSSLNNSQVPNYKTQCRLWKLVDGWEFFNETSFWTFVLPKAIFVIWQINLTFYAYDLQNISFRSSKSLSVNNQPSDGIYRLIWVGFSLWIVSFQHLNPIARFFQNFINSILPVANRFVWQ